MKHALWNKTLCLLLALVMLLGMLPAGVAAAEAELSPETITLDFMQFAKDAAAQEWWDDLRIDATDPDIHYQGYSGLNDAGAVTAAQKAQYDAAYASLRAYAEETTDWSVVENGTDVSNTGRCKRLQFHSGKDADWGMGFIIPISWKTWGPAYTMLNMTVDVPAAGTYNMDLSYWQDLSGAKFDLHINYGSNERAPSAESKVISALNTRGSEEKAVDYAVGQVELQEGINTIGIYVCPDTVGAMLKLRSIRFTPYTDHMDLSVEEGLTRSVSLQELYLPADESYDLVSEDRRVAVASLDAGGNVVIRGISEGETVVTVEKAGEVLYTVYVTVTERVSEVHVPRTIDIDLIAFAKKAADQPWWDDLAATNLPGVKAVGANYYNVIDDAQAAAFDAMQAYTRETEGWYFSDGNPIIGTYYSGRLIYIDPTSEDFGIRFFANILGNAVEDKSKMLFTVEVAEGDAGLYSLDIDAFHEGTASTLAPVAGRGGGSPWCDVYVNGEVVYKDMFFGVKEGKPNVRQTDSFGAVYLNEGTNIIGIDTLRDINGGQTTRRVLYLAGLTLTPLTTLEVEEGSRKLLDLRGTYLPFDAVVGEDTHTVVSSDAEIASAAFDAEGNLIVSGISRGFAALDVLADGEKLQTLEVQVGRPTGLIYDFTKAFELTQNGFDAIGDYGDLDVDDVWSEPWHHAEGEGCYDTKEHTAALETGEIAFTLQMDKEGWFDPEVTLYKHTGGGTAEIWLDGLYLGKLDTFAPSKTVRTEALRPVFITEGEHDLVLKTEGGAFWWREIAFRARKDAELLLTADKTALSMKQKRSERTSLSAVWNGGMTDSLIGARWTVEVSDPTCIEATLTEAASGVLPALTVKGLAPCEDGTVTVTARVGEAESAVTITVTVLEPSPLASARVWLDCVDAGIIARNSVHALSFDMVGEDGGIIYPDEVDITYTSSDESVITVEDHAIKALANGEATVDVVIRNGAQTFEETFELTVADAGEDRLSKADSDLESEDIHWKLQPEGSETFLWIERADDGTGNHALKVSLNPNYSYTELKNKGDEIAIDDGAFAKVKPGHIYEVTLRMKTEGVLYPEDYSVGLQNYLSLYDYADNTTKSASVGEMNATLVQDNKLYDDWTELTITVRAPLDYEGPFYIRPRFVIRPYTAADQALAGWQGTFWFDDIEVREVGFDGAGFELGSPMEQLEREVSLMVYPKTTTGKMILLDENLRDSNVKLTSTNDDVVTVGSSSVKRITGTDYYEKYYEVKPMGLNAHAQLLAEITVGEQTIVTPYDVHMTVMPDQFRDIVFELDGAASAVLKKGETASGEIIGRSTQLEMLTEQMLRENGFVYFKSDDTSIAVVDHQTGDVTCVGEGTTTITAYAMQNGTHTSAAATITVTDDTDLVSVAVGSEVDFVGVGNSLQLSVSGRKASGSRADMGLYPVAWSVDETAEGIASIDENGRLTAYAPGTVTVTASVSVMHTVISHSKTIKVVPNGELPKDDAIFDFIDGNAMDVENNTLDDDGYVVVYDACTGTVYPSMTGLLQDAAQGDRMVLDMVIPKDGWYWLEVRGGMYADTGSTANVFVDDAYMGFVNFRSSDHDIPGHYNALARMNTVYLTAGVHRVVVEAVDAGTTHLGKLYFFATDDPNEITLSIEPEKTELLVGESVDVTVRADGANGRQQSLLQVAAKPSFTNYYILNANANIVEVSGSQLIGKGAGTATVTFVGQWQGGEVRRSFDVTVSEGLAAYGELTAEKTTLRPDAGPFPLTLTAYGIDGTAVELPETVQVAWSSEDPAIASVEEGLVTITGELGSAKITAAFEENGRAVEAVIWITVTEGKTQPTIYTWEERTNAQENCMKYTWAWQEKESAVNMADYYVENLEVILDNWIREGTVPRSTKVGFLNSNADAYKYCRYCGVDVVGTYGHYPWIVDPIGNPWKITCPACHRDFPSNDFGAWYKSGLDDAGKFRPERADSRYLVNELYPEMGEGWGVDMGPGYDSGARHWSGGNVNDTHTYLAYYLHCVFVTTGSSKHSLVKILDTMREAYLYTGDEKYGNAGAILTDRVADIYPDYDRQLWGSGYSVADGNGWVGRMVGCIWEADVLGPAIAKASDAFWPCFDNDEVVAYIREHATWKGIAPEEIDPAYIRNNVDEGICLEIYRACQDSDMAGNFGMAQGALALAAVSLDRIPETEEMLDWTFRYGTRTGAFGDFHEDGGSFMYYLVDLVDRDGFGNEASIQYNNLWTGNMMDVADALSGYNGVESVDLWRNQKFVNMFLASTRITTMGHMTPLVGESMKPQSPLYCPNVEELTTAFVNSGNRDIARALYAANNNSVDGLHADIFTKDPESGLRAQVQRIVNEDGVWDMSQSDMMAGYGIAILRDGPETYLGTGSNASRFSDYWMWFGITGGAGHAMFNALHVDIEAFGLALSSHMGYPSQVTGSDPERQQWVRNTTSFNTVVVDDHGQSTMAYGSFPLHFEDAGKVKVMDADASNAYAQTDIYRRTMVVVDNGSGEDVNYAVDFFRVLGGSEHVYSFHAATRKDPATEGLSMVRQPMGTYAGADIPFGDYDASGTGNVTYNMEAGYSWLKNVSRDDSPETSFSIDWPIEDFVHRLPDSQGIHMKLHMVSEEPMTEVALADARPPENGSNPDTMKYALIRRSGDNGMDSLFTAVIEPYKIGSYIASVETAEVVLVEGTERVADRAAAVKVTLTSGRVDYVVYATNADCTYEIDGKFRFRGFTGVCSYENGALVYAWGSEAEQVADVVTDAQAKVTGTVTDFTKGIDIDGYTMTVEMDDPVSAEELTGRYIYVDNDGYRNAAYRIYGAEVSGDTAVLDLYTQTLVREYVDKRDLDRGYVYNISEDQTYTIPLSARFDVEDLFTYTKDLVVKTGNKLTLTTGVVGAGVTYEVEGLPTSAKVDAKTGTVTWTPSRTQTGRYPVTVKAMQDGEVMGEMEFVIYVVSYTGSSYEASKCNHAKAVSFEADGMIETVCPACG
ncbi:MAG: Ig-like domain-containing protein, partial [Oscillospiraceae bacterium]|nr:Ig-like domain-containing protein [Oscillospiraceae bacterium]